MSNAIVNFKLYFGVFDCDFFILFMISEKVVGALEVGVFLIVLFGVDPNFEDPTSSASSWKSNSCWLCFAFCLKMKE